MFKPFFSKIVGQKEIICEPNSFLEDHVSAQNAVWYSCG